VQLKLTGKYFLSLFFVLNFLFLSAQNNAIDSLKTAIKTAKDDTSKVNTLYRSSSLLVDAGDFEKAMDHALKGRVLAEKLMFKRGLAKTANIIAVIYFNQSKYSEAMAFYLESLKIKKELNDKKGMAKTLNNIAGIHENLGNFPEALNIILPL